MIQWLIFCQLLTSFSGVEASMNHAWCPEHYPECEFTLVVDYGMTMMADKTIIHASKGALYKFDAYNSSLLDIYPTNKVITADGYFEPRLVMTFNGTIPGPALHVRRGQRVRLRVINLLMHETTSVHVHGIHQKGTPYSDGVPFLSQCPILPGQTFVQTFFAEPEGTLLYHSHSGPQMTNGLYGAFIVHPYKGQAESVNKRATNEWESEKVVDERGKNEHILIFQDWNHDWDATMVTLKMRLGLFKQERLIPQSHTLAGTNYSAFHFQSGLVNGRGRSYDESTGKHNEAPLSVFTVTHGQQYRFRLTNAGDIHPFRVSVDNHALLVVASDGAPIVPIQAESVIVNPGERYDVVIMADQPVRNYWIRGHTLQVEFDNRAEAILHYEGAPMCAEPKTSQRKCTQDKPCVVVNCPFRYYPAGTYTKCINFDEIRSPTADPLQVPESGQVTEFIINFAFPGITESPGSANGRSYVNHPVAPLYQRYDSLLSCLRSDCGDDKICHCPYTVTYGPGELVQLVLLNMGQGKGWDHPIHIHGHYFQIVKTGFPVYDSTTGKFLRPNEDIQCIDQFCNTGRWANQSWENGHVPGMELSHAPIKDTIMVPSGGYIVTRFKADNPGLWFIHCHLELHLTDGMAAILNESFSQWPKPPPDFPTCNNFYDRTDYSRNVHPDQ